MVEENTKTRIVHHASELMDEAGVDGFSLREVARRVGITPMAVYRHFADKDALIEELLVLGFGRLNEFLQPALESKDPAERLAATFRCYLRFATEAPNTYALVFERHLRADPQRPERKAVPAFRFVVDRVRESMDAGLLLVDDPEAVALDLWALTHGLVTLRRAGKLELEPAAFDAYFDGMVKRRLRQGS